MEDKVNNRISRPIWSGRRHSRYCYFVFKSRAQRSIERLVYFDFFKLKMKYKQENNHFCQKISLRI